MKAGILTYLGHRRPGDNRCAERVYAAAEWRQRTAKTRYRADQKDNTSEEGRSDEYTVA